jgi:hypothetical protein
MQPSKEFDIHRPAVHHEPVKSSARVTVLLVAAMLLTWHGVLLSTPHNHADNTVPREMLNCSASRPSSQINHLHASGRLLTAHACLACLAGSTVAHAPGVQKVAVATVNGPSIAAAHPGLRPRLHTHLPLLRGPPVFT